jgi:hypothetical protein
LPARTENSIKNRFYSTIRKYANKSNTSIKSEAQEVPAPVIAQAIHSEEAVSEANAVIEAADEEINALLNQVLQLEELLSLTREELL